MLLRDRAPHDDAELLDDPSTPRVEAERSLRDLERFNRWAGGSRIYRKMVARLGLTSPAILDIGTGTSDLLRTIDEASIRVGLDLNYHHLWYGRHRSPGEAIARTAGDASHLPFASESFDVVTSSHFFHHFDQTAATHLVDEALRVARHAIVFSDTRRSFAPWLFTKLLARLRVVGRVTRHDAPASVLRGFNLEELTRIGEATGRPFEVTRYLPFRVTLTVWRS